jgi:hypothetical protein
VGTVGAELGHAPEHVVQLLALLAVENVPEVHALQPRSLVAVPAVDTYWPALQLVHVAQLPALLAVENVPELHALQPWSLVAVPAVDTY